MNILIHNTGIAFFFELSKINSNWTWLIIQLSRTKILDSQPNTFQFQRNGDVKLQFWKFAIPRINELTPKTWFFIANLRPVQPTLAQWRHVATCIWVNIVSGNGLLSGGTEQSNTIISLKITYTKFHSNLQRSRGIHECAKLTYK